MEKTVCKKGNCNTAPSDIDRDITAYIQSITMILHILFTLVFSTIVFVHLVPRHLTIRSSCETLRPEPASRCNSCTTRDRPRDSSLVPPSLRTRLIRSPRIYSIVCGSCDPTPPPARFRPRRAPALSVTCRRSSEARTSCVCENENANQRESRE